MNRSPRPRRSLLGLIAKLNVQGAGPSTLFCFVCPRCRGELVLLLSAYRCDACVRSYPIIFGIPDFRLRSDRYLTLEQEREKAGRLHEFAKTHTFEEMIAYYYSITHDLPSALVARYQAGIIAAPEKAAVILEDLRPDPAQDMLLDIGCGTGGLLAAAQGHYRAIVGADIALRWLVVCRKRLEGRGAVATLVCADAEALPFRDGGFTQAVAADLIDHVYDPATAFTEVRRQLSPDGRFWVSAMNRYCIGPHPMTGVWATGFLPRSMRAWVLTRLRGIDLLRYANMLSAGQVERLLQNAGFVVSEKRPKRLGPTSFAGYPASDRILIWLYRIVSRFRILHFALLKAGPAFEMVARKKAD